jgi:4-amino-4-deoxy-L-arabinose transferase
VCSSDLNGEYHWSKPPLAYLAIAAGMAVLGENTWGVRIFLSLAFVLTVLGVYYLGAELWGKGAAPLCALVYATSPFTYASANVVSTDVLLTLWETLAVLFFWLALRRRHTTAVLLMWLAFGLAFLTKGPVTLLAFCGVVPTYIIVKRRDREIPRLLTVSGIAVFALVGLGWYLFEALLEPGLLKYWISDEIVGRNLQGEFNRNTEWYRPFSLYLPIILFGASPWAFLAVLYRKHFPWPKGKWFRWLDWENGVEWTYLILSFFPPLLVFSLVKSRLPLYVLFLFVPLSLALGKGLHWLVLNHRIRMDRLLYLACCSLLLWVGVKRVVAERDTDKDMKTLAQSLAPFLDTDRPCYLMMAGNRPLNGLQFYLHGMVPVLPAEELRETLIRWPESQIELMVLIRQRHLEDREVTELIKEGSVTIREIDKNWALILPGTKI